MASSTTQIKAVTDFNGAENLPLWSPSAHSHMGIKKVFAHIQLHFKIYC